MVWVVGTLAIGRAGTGGIGLPLRVVACVAAVVATVIVACRYPGGDINCDQRSEEIEKGGREFHEGDEGWVWYDANTTGKDF